MSIVKTNQYIENGASLSNEYGTSNENGYSQEYINGLGTYSTDEVRIGTWIDGKPLYRKVINGNQELLNGTQIVTNIPFDTCVSITGMFNSSDNSATIPFPSYTSSTSYLRMVLNDFPTGGLGVQSGFTSSTIRKTIIILEYTKTTD